MRIQDWEESAGHGREGPFTDVQKAPSALWASPVSHDCRQRG